MEAAIDDVKACGYPDIGEWNDSFLRARARATDAEAIGVFGPKDGRQVR